MSGAPTLTHKDVVDRLDELYRSAPQRERHLVAFFGTGAEEDVQTAHAGKFRIVPVRSELELREQMPALESEDDRIAFLVPFLSEIPLDLRGRFARNGHVFRIGSDARLLTMLGASELEDAVRKSALAKHLLATVAQGAVKVASGRVTLAGLYRAWLAGRWGFDAGNDLTLDALLAWAAFDAKANAFHAAMSAPVAAGVRDELLSHLGSKLGPAGPVVWKAWEAGRGRAVMQYAILLQTLARSEHAGVRMWVKIAPRATLEVPEAEMPAIASALGAAADSAIRRLEQDSARKLVKEADSLAENQDVRDALVGDRRLPSAWRSRLDALGAALQSAAASPSADALTGAVRGLRALETHIFFNDRDQTALIQRAEMCVRLCAWLAVRSDREVPGSLASYADAEKLARWYADEGGYVDWARKMGRGTSLDAFGAGAQAVVMAADIARQELDHRFARGLSSWVEAGRPSGNVLPIDQAVQRIAVRFLEENPARQLLVLLMDGMAWAQAVELLQSLGQRTAPWAPLAWQKGRVGMGANPPVLAALPTMTEFSRAAFFGGKVIEPGAQSKTEKDVDRWCAHSAVQKLLPVNEAPKLLLRGEAHTNSGAASNEALALVADKSKRIVAIVINAIDASLKSDPQQRHEWKAESIQPLLDLLERARDADRSVLFAADHGHVPADRLVNIGKPEDASARWRPWQSPDEKLGPHEVGFRGSGVWVPKGAHGVVLLADDASRYGGAPHAGEHGGATLAEVVAPCLLIGCEDVAFGKEDSGLNLRGAFVPPWWHFDLKPPVALLGVANTESTLNAPTKPPKKRTSSSQLALPGLPRASAFASSAVLAALKKSPAERDQIVAAVEFLLERNGVATVEAFAAAMGEISYRVGGRVSKLAEALNVDGFTVIHHDTTHKMIHLDREKLAQQFEVNL